MPTPLQRILLRKGGGASPEGEGWSPQGLSPIAQSLMAGPQQRGPNYGRMGGGLFGMGISTPMATGFNPSAGMYQTPMMSRRGLPTPQTAAFYPSSANAMTFGQAAPQAPVSTPVQQAQTMSLSDPSQGGQGFSGYSDPEDEPGMGGFGGWT